MESAIRLNFSGAISGTIGGQKTSVGANKYAGNINILTPDGAGVVVGLKRKCEVLEHQEKGKVGGELDLVRVKKRGRL